jgi:hypothetical protein
VCVCARACRSDYLLVNKSNTLVTSLFMYINCTEDVQYELEGIRVTFQTIFQLVEVAQLDGRYDVIINTICQPCLVTDRIASEVSLPQ